MCVALVGGMDRLKRRYEMTALARGVDLRHFERSCPRFEEKMEGVDAIIIFTNRISHNARKRALSKGAALGVPVLMYHSSGLSSLRRCLDEITKGK